MRRTVCAVFLSAALWVVTAHAEDVKLFNQPLKVSGGGLERLRHEYWQNIFDMNSDTLDNRNFFRVKTSLWGQIDFGKDIDVYARMTNENYAYMYYYQPKSGKKDLDYNINETIFDNLYADVRNAAKLPLDVRIGRQDLMTYGEGFLIMDGTPLDGSRTYYFNAAKVTWNIDPKNIIDALYIYNTDFEKFLPVINEYKGSRALNYTDETAFALYQKSDSVPNLHLEDYYIFKKEDAGGPKASAKETILNTAGIFAKYTYNSWTLRGQFADQFGFYGDSPRTGIGWYAFLDKTVKQWPLSPTASFGFIYLSGDNIHTCTNEMWDPLFSRYPWMSELYVLAYNSETGMGYWTNLQMYRTSVVFTLVPERAKLTLFYNYLRANEVNMGDAVFSGTGRERGHLPQARIDVTITKNVTAYFLAEYFIPGNYYVNDDPAIFLRTEVMVKF